MSDQGIDTAGRSLAASYLEAGMPLGAHLDVTYRCDLACKHCYLDDRETWPELTTLEWQDVLAQLAGAGVLDLTWSGGDVGMRSDFRELVAHAAELGFQQRIKTHGGWIDDQTARWLGQQNVHRVDISVYSLRDAVHDAFTQRPGSLQATLAAIHALRNAGLEVKISCSIQPATICEVQEIVQTLQALGCKVSISTLMYRDHAGGNALDAFQLSPEQVLEVRRALRRVRPTGELSKPIASRPGSTPCGAGRTRIYVSPDGAVWPCVTWPMELGHLRQQRFADIWAGSARRQEILAWTNDDRTQCQSCAGSGACFYCPGHAYKTTGDYRKASPDFHAQTRVKLLVAQEFEELVLTPEQWDSIPDTQAERPPVTDQPTKMYRPSRGKAVRVHQLALGQAAVNRR
jgi:MoaA/NifB/PqqE/SkfB family radical SAM enzyme